MKKRDRFPTQEVLKWALEHIAGYRFYIKPDLKFAFKNLECVALMELAKMSWVFFVKVMIVGVRTCPMTNEKLQHLLGSDDAFEEDSYPLTDKADAEKVLDFDPDNEAETTSTRDNSWLDLTEPSKTESALFSRSPTALGKAIASSEDLQNPSTSSSSANARAQVSSSLLRRGWAPPSPFCGIDITTCPKDTAKYWVVRMPPEAAQDGIRFCVSFLSWPNILATCTAMQPTGTPPHV